MALTEKEFSMMKKKMDKINHRLDELYKNWHAEYGNVNTIEECEEIKNFYKPICKSMNPNTEFIPVTNTNYICPRYTGEATKHLSGPS